MASVTGEMDWNGVVLLYFVTPGESVLLAGSAHGLRDFGKLRGREQRGRGVNGAACRGY